MTRLSEYFIATLKQEQESSDITSYRLCLRAGLVRKIASGIYSYLPLGLRIIRKIENIVREEMNKTGAMELMMPAVQPSDLWMQSGRWSEYGPELFRLKDRNERDFCLGPTHEEIITFIAHHDIKSYKDLPINLYQIQTKFRDEMRPRYGILRAREFIMKDAYSFTADEKGLDEIYEKMYKCYCKILERMNLKYFAVMADTGLIGGKYSHEFIILAKNGEDEIVYCPECGYGANYEMADYINMKTKEQESATGKKTLSEVSTPGITDIDSLSSFLKTPPEKIIKTIILKDQSGNHYAFLLAGNRELNMTKAEKITGKKLEFIDRQDKGHGFKIGFIGPAGLDENIKIFADNSLKAGINYIAGANKIDYHLVNINHPEDFRVDSWHDLSFPLKGDRCLKCSEELKFEKGIEIGHIFKLGTKYSEKMNAGFLDSDGRSRPLIMGCYGIGISRIMAASIEQLSDDYGIIWPISIAPFMVNLIAINVDDPDISEACESVYKRMLSENIDIVYDDRNMRAGAKFKDSDLIGIPVKMIIGKKFIEDSVIEIELRKNREKFTMDLDSAIKFIKEYPLKNSF